MEPGAISVISLVKNKKLIEDIFVYLNGGQISRVKKIARI